MSEHPSHPINWRDRDPPQPRDYQVRGINAAFEAFGKGFPGALFRQSTGTGKTVSGICIADQWLSMGPDRRVMVIAHERQLIQQFADEIEDFLGVRPGIEMADEKVHKNFIPPITVASRATLYEKISHDLKMDRVQPDVEWHPQPGRPSRHERLVRHTKYQSRLYKFHWKYKWLIILDECHRWRWTLPSCKHIIEWFARNPDSRRLGLTATPLRSDGVSLQRMFPAVASDYRLWEPDASKPCSIRDGWNVAYDQRFIQVEGVDFSNIKEVAGDFDEAELEAAIAKKEELSKLIEPMLDLVEDRTTIIFNLSVQMAKEVAMQINAEIDKRRKRGDTKLWGSARSLDGSVPDGIRRDTYLAFERREFQFLSVCALAREGYNNPNLQAVAIFRPTKSQALAEQMKGRGCRPLRGVLNGLDTPEERRAAIAASAKPSCMVIDMVGITGLADCASTAQIFADGKPDEVVKRANENAVKKTGDGKPIDMAAEVENAEKEIAAERAAQEAAEAEAARRRAKIDASVRYNERRVEQGHGNTGDAQRPRARMPYGRHKGKLVVELSTGYLKTLMEKSPPRAAWLRAAINRVLAERAGGGKNPPSSRLNHIASSIERANMALLFPERS